MLTHSTAHYFAKRAYRLRLTTGREQQTAMTKAGAIEIRHHPGAIAIIHVETEKVIEFRPIPKAWREF